MSPPKMRFRDLPEYLRKRIKIGAGRESGACWEWTGKVKAARQRYRPYPAIEREDGYREHAGRFTNEAATPLVRHPVTGKEEDARRHIYGVATMALVCDVPTLKRCCDTPRCVSPWHVVPGVLTAAQRRRVEGLQPAAVAVVEEWTAERCFALLRAADDGDGVSWGVDRLTAANVAGIPSEELTEAYWGQYVREEIEKEESADA